MPLRRTLSAVTLSVATIAACTDGTRPRSADCSGAPLSIAVGQTHQLAGAAAAKMCVGGAEGGSEYVAVLHSSSTDATDTLRLDIEATGVGPLASLADADRAVIELGPAGSRSALRPLGERPVRDQAFHARLRARERRLEPYMAAARDAVRARRVATASGTASTSGPRYAIGSPNLQIGEVVTINASTEACENPINRTGEVVAIGTHSIIVHDEQNPANGFTTAEYESIAATFDTLIYPVAVANFGVPEDIDDNQKVFIFYTAEVNKLTEKGSGSYVGGFYFVRDLFPRTDQPGFQGCPTSNEAEVFYMLVPDPNAEFGDQRTKDFVMDVTLGTIAHEFQHLINASRRMFVNDAAGFEARWLDEGLAHISEELMFYEAAGVSPRSNLDLDDLRSSAVILDAFNLFGISNFFRLEDFLQVPGTNSPYDTDDDLAARGAAWHFLRYAADRRGGDEQTFWFGLANSTSSGMANLNAAVGGQLTAWLRDWAVALYADDRVSGIAPQHRLLSWDLRSIFSANPPFTSGYPLPVALLAEATPVSRRLIGGGVGYVRLTVSEGTEAEIDVTAGGGLLPSTFTVTLVRTR